MAKKKNLDEINEIDFSSLATEIGANVLSETDNVKNWIDTGILSFNYLCSGKFVGGGIPSGKIIEIFGNSSSCKTLFALNILHGVQKANGVSIFIDAEGTLSKDFATKAAHVDPSKIIVLPPSVTSTLEKCFKAMYMMIKKVRAKYGPEKPIVIIYDSIAASPSEREFASTNVEDGMSKAKIKEMGAGPAKPGERAKTCSEELRKLTPILEKENCSVVFINQVRQKIGVMYGNNETTAGGGKSLEFYASIRIKTRASKKLKDKLENVIGMCVSMSNEKNKVFKPFINAQDMHLFFDKGINPFGGLLDLLIKQGRIVGKGAGSYRVCEPWCDGEEIVFKSSRERNDIPPDVLLRCPKLVDADDPKQIQSYLDKFGNALSAVDTDIGSEQELQEDESFDE